MIFLNTISDFLRLGMKSPPLFFGQSSYTFHKTSAVQKLNWEESRRRCKDTGSDLVSIESKKEWIFLENITQTRETAEYFIGLRKDSKSGDWKWISDNSKVDAIREKFPWAKDEPNGDGNCAVMYKDYMQDYGLFNDLSCTEKQRDGYICESPVNSTDQEGMSYKLLCYLLRFNWTFLIIFSLNSTLQTTCKRWLKRIQLNEDNVLLVMRIAAIL